MNKGAQIETLEQLLIAANARKSTIGNNSLGIRPAAFLINMQAYRVHHILKAGLWVYVPYKSSAPFPVVKKSNQNL